MKNTIKPNSLSILFMVRQDRGKPIFGKNTSEEILYNFDLRYWQTKSGVRDTPIAIYPKQIVCRVTINSKPFMVSTGEKVDPTLWDHSSQRMKGTGKTSRIVNDKLVRLEIKVKDLFNEMDDKLIHIKDFKHRFHGLDKKTPTLFFKEACERFIEHSKHKELSESTIDHYVTMIHTLDGFVSHKFRNDVPIDMLNEKDIYIQVKRYFQDEGYANGSINNMLSLLRNIFLHTERTTDFKSNAVSAEYLPRAESYKFYSDEELAAINGYEAPSDRKDLMIMHKVTLLQIEIGLAHTDMQRLSYSDIQIKMDKNGKRGNYIYIHRKKSSELAVIPVTPTAERLMDELKPYIQALADTKRDELPPYLKRFVEIKQKPEFFSNKIVPMPSRGNCSRMLREIGEGIGVKMTTHRARHSFGTKMLQYFSLESVSRMLGHKTVSTTERIYAKVLDKRVISDTINYSWDDGKTTYLKNG